MCTRHITKETTMRSNAHACERRTSYGNDGVRNESMMNEKRAAPEERKTQEKSTALVLGKKGDYRAL